MSRARAVLAAAALAAVTLLPACGARGASLGTSSDACFHALPAASDAVADRGKFLGVRLLPVSRLPRITPADTDGLRRVCAAAFRGPFQPGEVENPLRHTSGTYAIVVVSPDGKRVIGTLLLDRLPIGFRHL